MENGSGQEQRLRGGTHRVAVAMGTGLGKKQQKGLRMVGCCSWESRVTPRCPVWAAWVDRGSGQQLGLQGVT